MNNFLCTNCTCLGIWKDNQFSRNCVEDSKNLDAKSELRSRSRRLELIFLLGGVGAELLGRLRIWLQLVLFELNKTVVLKTFTLS